MGPAPRKGYLGLQPKHFQQQTVQMNLKEENQIRAVINKKKQHPRSLNHQQVQIIVQI